MKNFGLLILSWAIAFFYGKITGATIFEVFVILAATYFIFNLFEKKEKDGV